MIWNADTYHAHFNHDIATLKQDGRYANAVSSPLP